jgi:hypothetical protein
LLHLLINDFLPLILWNAPHGPCPHPPCACDAQKTRCHRRRLVVFIKPQQHRRLAAAASALSTWVLHNAKAPRLFTPAFVAGHPRKRRQRKDRWVSGPHARGGAAGACSALSKAGTLRSLRTSGLCTSQAAAGEIITLATHARMVQHPRFHGRPFNGPATATHTDRPGTVPVAVYRAFLKSSLRTHGARWHLSPGGHRRQLGTGSIFSGVVNSASPAHSPSAVPATRTPPANGPPKFCMPAAICIKPHSDP